MKCLLVNDDGIRAEGIWALARLLCKEHQVVIVAPDSQRSGASHSVTLHGTVRYTEYPNDLCKAYSMTGTPCDCVKFGLLQLAVGADCVISGVNDAANIGTDILYSGTVNAAIEGAMCGVRSVAVSAKVLDDNFEYPARFVVDNLERLLSLCCDDVIVSVNMPHNYRSKLRGVRIASCGERRFGDYYQSQEDGYQLLGDALPVCNEPNSDVVLYHEGYITVSPVRVSFTDTAAMCSWTQVEDGLCW